MRERSILLKAHEVRGILSGRQSQVRRAMKHQPQPVVVPGIGPMLAIQQPRSENRWLWPNARDEVIASCPYGKPGDRLWVKETTVNVEEHGYIGPVYAESDEGQDCLNWGLAPAPDDMTEVEPHELRLRPSIFMKRSMSRITLEITGVRVERLQFITEADAMAEGAEPILVPPDGGSCPYYEGFRELWGRINGPSSWDANPWVWVVEFKRVDAQGGPNG